MRYSTESYRHNVAANLLYPFILARVGARGGLFGLRWLAVRESLDGDMS